MKKINLILKKCKTLSRQLGRTSSSYSSLRSKSARHHQEDHQIWGYAAHMMMMMQQEDRNLDEDCETIFVGSSRRRFLIKSKYLDHPLLKAIIDKSNKSPGDQDCLSVKCEVVLFDHLIWMLDNADPNFTTSDTCSLEELADLYLIM